MNRLPAPFLLVAAMTLASCSADRTPPPAAPASPAAPAPASASMSDATQTATAAAQAPVAPGASAGTPGSDPARYDGYGDMRFGMTEAEARKAWGGKLNGQPGDGCHYLNPVWEKAPSHFAFMIDGGKFVRYDVGNDKEVAPGGGRRGMSEAEIDTAYPGRVEKTPHKYVAGGKYLKVRDDGGSDGVLVFETDAAGTVTEWHAGVAPQVDYVEGCS